jgi:MFS family permease
MTHSGSDTIYTRNFLLIFFASLLMFTAFYFMLPTLPVYLTQKLGVTESQTGIILSIYTLAALLIRPFTGFAIDRYGRRGFYIISLLLFSLIFIGYPFAALFSLMLFIRFLHGLVWGVATTTASTLIVDIIPPKRRGEGLGLYGLAMTIPMAAGPLAGLQLSSGGTYSRMFFAASILAVLAFALSMLVKYPKVPHTQHSAFSWRNLFENSAIPVSANLLIINITYGGLVSFVSLYAINTGIGHTGTFFMVFAIGIAVARLIMGKIFDKHGPFAISVSGISLLIIGYILLGFIKTLPVFLISASLLGLGSGIIFPAFQAMVNNMVPPQRRGAANSTLFSGLDLGIGIGMLLTGILANKIGLPATYSLFSVVNLAALLFFIFISYALYSRKLNH